MKSRVVVVGSFVQDLTWECAAFPRAGETVIGRFVTGPGGKGSNQAVAAARAGAAAVFVGAVGRDVFAQGAAAFYRSEGIAGRFIAKPGHATGTAAILVNSSAQNQIVVALGASAQLKAADIDTGLIRGAGVVVCQHEATLKVNAHVFRLARCEGATTILNPAPMRADFDPAILAHTDILIPNETEFVALINSPGRSRSSKTKALTEAGLAKLRPSAVHAICRTLRVPTVIVTLGRRGCLVSQPDAWTFLPAYKVKAVDTTGAGDAFVGGFAAGFVQSGGDIVAAARHGNAVAALSVTKPGTAPSMPTRKEIATFLRRTSLGNRR